MQQHGSGSGARHAIGAAKHQCGAASLHWHISSGLSAAAHCDDAEEMLGADMRVLDLLTLSFKY